MTEKALARLWIGGHLPKSRSHELVLAVRKAGVSIGTPGLEHILCEPRSIDGLLVATDEGVLHLQVEAAPGIAMPLLTKTCRKLGLTYRLWQEAMLDEGCRVETWEPGMRQPLRFHGDQDDPHAELVEALPIRLAIGHLRAGRVERALMTLEHACPDTPDVPSLVVVDD